MDNVKVNPFFVGNEFMNYCIRKGWITLEFSDDKRLHYFLNERGALELKENFGIIFGSPCSLEANDE